MLKYRGSHLTRHGAIGLVLMGLIIAVGLQPEKLTQWAGMVRYKAVFTESAGLESGNDVRIAGMTVGSVTDITLDHGKALVTFTVDSAIEVGTDTSAHIGTGTLLGARILTLVPSGSGRLRPRDVIPISRSSSPYSLTDAVGDLAANTAATDTGAINQALDTLSTTLDQIAPQLGPVFDGVTRLSRTLNARDDTLRQLLGSARTVTQLLGERSGQLNTLILDTNSLIGVLNERREAIIGLLADISSVSHQLSGLVADNEKQLAPALQKLNSVAAMLEKHRDNIGKALPGLAKYQVTQGEAVSSGFYYQAYEPNLIPAQLLQPFLDYAFGFRRGVDAGQPPDNVGPRAEFPLPYNGIPGGSR